jgi:hypothetical protein
VRATGLNLNVDGKRLTVVQKQQAITVAIALVAVAFQKPLPPYPPVDHEGGSAHDVAREAGGFDAFLQHWR